MQDTFESGYTKALLDAQRMLETAFWVWQGKLTKKHIMSLWAILVQNRAMLRESGNLDGANILFNRKDGFFIRNGGEQK